MGYTEEKIKELREQAKRLETEASHLEASGQVEAEQREKEAALSRRVFYWKDPSTRLATYLEVCAGEGANKHKVGFYSQAADYECGSAFLSLVEVDRLIEALTAARRKMSELDSKEQLVLLSVWTNNATFKLEEETEAMISKLEALGFIGRCVESVDGSFKPTEPPQWSVLLAGVQYLVREGLIVSGAAFEGS